MTAQNVRLKVTSPALKLKAAIRLDATVKGTGFITVTQSGMTFTVAMNIDPTNASNLSSGTVPLARLPAGTRQALSADQNYYVATTGSDSNAGTVGAPFLTVAHALAVASALDTAGHNITINCAAGTYTGAIAPLNMIGTGSVTITGVAADATNPTKTAFLNVTGTLCNSVNPLVTPYTFSNLKLKATLHGINIQAPGLITVTDCDLNGAAAGGVFRATLGGQIIESANFCSGNATFLYVCGPLGLIQGGGTMSFQGNVTFLYTAYADAVSYITLQGKTFTLNAHTVTGTRYNAVLNGVITTGGGGPNFIPGSTAGGTGVGGQYI